jgi:hypothetical protein
MTPAWRAPTSKGSRARTPFIQAASTVFQSMSMG